jgi:Icc-related predicted phosphoesterase
MRIAAISDTHNKHRKINIPECDVFLHAGDISDFNRSKNHYIDFNDWVGSIQARHKVIIAGNHDELFQKHPEEAKSIMTNCTYLEDDWVVIDGFKIYGSPWQKWFYNWAFNLQTNEELRKMWDKIPDDTDILITHSPPYQICDWNFNGKSLGCKELFNKVFKVKPKLHIFGHIHGAYGKYAKFGSVLFYNVTNDMLSNQAYVIEI